MTAITEETPSQTAPEKPRAKKRAGVGAHSAHVAPKKGRATKKASPAKKAPKAAKQAGVTRDGSKAANILDLLKRPEGATLRVSRHGERDGNRRRLSGRPASLRKNGRSHCRSKASCHQLRHFQKTCFPFRFVP